LERIRPIRVSLNNSRNQPFPQKHPKIQQQDAHSEFRPTLCRPLSEINGRYLCDPLSPGDPAE
ncbi:hypothetical protein CDAR_388131, partial [Caerostris darwini]